MRHAPVTIYCQYCHKPFTVPYGKRHRKYCSKKCYGQALRKCKPRICPICKKSFIPLTISRPQSYCSRKCSGIAQRKRITLICQQCDRPYEVKQHQASISKYCSRKCQNLGCRNGEHRTCLNCGTRFYIRYGEIAKGSGVFCSFECRVTYKVGKEAANWKGGYCSTYGPNWMRQRGRARKRDNYTCQLCGKVQTFPKHSVHHIKPFREFDGDWRQANRLSNLITLCLSCHQKVEHGHVLCPLSEKPTLVQLPLL